MEVSWTGPRLGRRISEYAFLAFCWAATVVAVGFLAAILWSLLSQDVYALLCGSACWSPTQYREWVAGAITTLLHLDD